LWENFCFRPAKRLQDEPLLSLNKTAKKYRKNKNQTLDANRKIPDDAATNQTLLETMIPNADPDIIRSF